MEIKKTAKADLEKGKGLGLLMGIVVALAIMFVSFEWSSSEFQAATGEGVADIVAEEEIEITVQDENTPPPPPPPPAQIDPEVLNVVEDDVEVASQDIMSSEDSQTDAQTETYVPPAIEEEEEEASNEIFVVVEEMPEFPGGMSELMSYLSKSIKYPVVAQENGISGRVSVAFVVNKDGSIVDAEVVRGIDASLDKEALRVINAMPKWKAGKQRGKPVRVKFTLPVNFRLQN
ncbi:MAG: energy transducer TonB [Tannerella sp.]|jgi:protein TonB|nr:energy transducer TonB [Tannerella sp.]